MDERTIIAEVERREAAVDRLRDAVTACRDAALTREEILTVIRALFADDEGTVN